MPEEIQDDFTSVPDYDTAAEQLPENVQYTEGIDLINQQTGLTQSGYQQELSTTQGSYADLRQQRINTYQDTLDQIKFGMEEVGIQTRAGSASRQLYDASGQLSGIGQGVAARNIAPLTRQLTSTGKQHSLAMESLGRREQEDISGINLKIEQLTGLDSQQKYDLKNKIVQGIIDQAAATRGAEITAYKDARDFELKLAEAEGDIPGTQAYIRKNRDEQAGKGRNYISSPAERDRLIAQGRHVIQMGDDFFALSEKEERDILKQEYDLGKPYFNPNTGTTDKVTQTDKNQYNLALREYNGLPITSFLAVDEPGSDTKMTREEYGAIVAEDNPFMNPKDIMDDIYDMYPSTEERNRPKTAADILSGYIPQ